MGWPVAAMVGLGAASGILGKKQQGKMAEQPQISERFDVSQMIPLFGNVDEQGNPSGWGYELLANLGSGYKTLLDAGLGNSPAVAQFLGGGGIMPPQPMMPMSPQMPQNSYSGILGGGAGSGREEFRRV